MLTRKQIILSFIAPSILATGVVVSFLHVRLLDSAIDQWIENNQNFISLLKEHISDHIDTSKQLLIATSEQPAFSSLDFLDQVNPKINGIPESAGIEKRQILETLRNTFSILFVLSPNGDHYISHPYTVQKKLIKFNLSDRSYFIQASKTKQAVISNSFIGADGIPAIAIDVPILNNKNTIIAHLGGVFHLSKLEHLVNTDVIAPFNAGFIVDKKNHIIAQTKIPLLEHKKWQIILNNLKTNKTVIGSKHNKDTIQNYTDPQTDKTYIISSSTMANGWFMVLLKDKNSLTQSIRPQVLTISFLVFLMLTAIGFIGFILAIKIAQHWKSAEDKLLQAQNELEARVIDRTYKLEQSEQRFRRLFENSETSIWNEDFSKVKQKLTALRQAGVTDLYHYLQENTHELYQFIHSVKIIDINEATLVLFGAQSKKDFIGHIDKTFGSDGIEVFIQGLCAIWNNDKKFHSQANYRTLDGKEFTAIISFQLPEIEEDFSSIPVSIYDISDRIEAEKKLSKLSQVVEQSPVSVIITDTMGNIEYVNHKFETTTGYLSHEVIGENPRILSSGKKTKQEYEALWQTILSGDVWTGIFYNKGKKGNFFWERAQISSLKDDTGQITHFISIKENISQQRSDEKNLRLASAVFEIAAEGIMVTDTDNHIQLVNQAFSKITGYSNDEALGKSPAFLKSGRHKAEFYQEMFATLEQTNTWNGEIWNRRKNGEIYPQWLSISTMRDSEGYKEGYVSLFSDITKRKKDEEYILHQANYDPLTGLANRNLFSDRFSHALKQVERNKHQVALLFIDLDRFKNINDTLGHLLGDQLLKQASKRLQACLRKSDTVARLGGDEFSVILPDIMDVQSINSTVEKILSAIAKPFKLDGHDAFISASIGITIYPDDADSVQELIRNADSAMYKAKDKGRNGFHFFTQAINIEAQQRRVLENALHKALSNKEFYLCFQPIINLKTNTIGSTEALVRWRHPEKGIISPVDFIPLAEEISLIIPIGEWILREACREAVKWGKNTSSSPCVAVNLSSRQFQQQNIPQLVASVLAETGLAPEKLTLEITESLLVSDNDSTLEQLQEIRKMNIGLAIDDFGTGYSSLSYLKKFPITILKIDRSFIMDLPDNKEDAALVTGILSMAHSLKLKVIAEGVETQAQEDFLKSHGCQFIQGYLHSKPLPKDDFFKLLPNIDG